MAGVEVAVGYVTLLPKMGAGFKSGVDSALRSSGTSASAAFSASFTGGLGAMGVAAGNVISSAIGTACAAVSSSVGSAVARVDTLNQFPKVMQNLGFSTEAAQASLASLSDGIQGLPTALDEIVGNAQALSLTLDDLGRGTDVVLGLNDGMLTYGASAAYVNNAVFQLNQMISAGSYDMESWRSVMESAPGYLDQVAKACLGTGASANDLRVALNGGKVTTDQFLDAIVRLDKEGGEGVVAFSEQAKSATGGIATSFTNVGTAVTRNLANFIDAVNGEENRVAQLADLMKSAVNDLGAAALPVGEALGQALGAGLDAASESYARLREEAGGLHDWLFGTEEVVEEVADSSAQASEETLATYQDLFDRMWNGDFGNGAENRTAAFEAMGLSAEQYDAVQALVNEHGADYTLTMEDLESVLGDVAGATGDQAAATKKASNVIKEATTGALTPYIEKAREMLIGTDRTVDAFDEFGTKVGQTVAHTDGLIDDLGQSWEAFWTAAASGSSLGGSIKAATLEFDFPDDQRQLISDACDALDRLSGAAADAAGAVGPSAQRAWESFSGCVTALAKTSFDSTLSFFTLAADPIANVASSLSSFSSDTLDNVSGVFDAIATSAPEIGGTLTEDFAQVFSDTADALVAMEPAASSLVGLATDTLAATISTIADNVGSFGAAAKDASGWVKSLAEEEGPKLAEFFDGIDPQVGIDRVAGFVATVYWDLHGLAEYVAGEDGPAAKITGALAATADNGDTIFDAIEHDATTALGVVTIAAAGISGVVGSLVESVGKAMSGDALGAVTSFNEGVTTAVDTAVAEFQYLFGGEFDTLMPGVAALLDTVSDAVPKVDDLAQACEDAGMSSAGVQAVTDAINGVDTSGVSLSAEDTQALAEAMSSLDPAVAQQAASALDAMCKPAHDAGEGLRVTADMLGDTCDGFDTLGDSVTMTEDEFAKFLTQANSDTTQIADVTVKKGAITCGALQGVGDSAADLGGEFRDAASRCSNLAGQLQALLTYDGKTVTVNVVTEYSTSGTPTSASSGASVIPHAAGGVTNGLHVVGEAGPEAIVPLYKGAMEPYALQVAEFLDKDGARGGDTYNVRVDNAHVNDDDAVNAATGRYIMELKRLKVI